jgi:hypothetical protein
MKRIKKNYVILWAISEKGPNEGDRTTSITTVSARPCEDIDARQFPAITEKMVHGFLLP